MFGRLLVIILEGISVILIATIFSPENKGLLSLLMLYVAYAHQIGELGIYQSAVYFTSKYKNFKQENYLPNILSLGHFVSFFLSLIFLTILINLNLFGYLNIETKIIYLLCLILFFLSVSNILYHLLIGQKRVLNFVIIKIFQSIIFLISNFVLWKTLKNFEIYHTLICYAFSLLISFTILVIIHKYNKTSLKFEINFKVWFNILKFTIKGHPGRILWNLNNKLDFFIISYFMSNYYVGVYSIAVTFAETLSFFASSIGAILLPYIASSNKKNSIVLSNLIIKHCTILTLIAGICLMIIGPIFITYVFDLEYHGAIEPLMYLVPGVICLSISRVISNHLVGIGKPELQSYGVGFAFLIMIILNIVLIPKFGIVGAAIASSLAYTIETCIIIYFYLRESSQKLNNIFYIEKYDFELYINILKKILNKK